MQTLRQEYRKTLIDDFKELTLAKPLFYISEFGLRFNLQTGDTFNSTRQVIDSDGNTVELIGDTDSEEYFTEVNNRVNALFDFSVDDSDKLLLVYRDYRFKRRRLKLTNYVFKQIRDLKKNEVVFIKESDIYSYSTNEKFNIYNTALIKLTKERLNHKNLFKAIGNSDFPIRLPRLDNMGFLTSKELFFINLTKKMIFHMYDDRGIDIVASDKEILKPIYLTFNDWILEHDREQINRQFE